MYVSNSQTLDSGLEPFESGGDTRVEGPPTLDSSDARYDAAPRTSVPEPSGPDVPTPEQSGGSPAVSREHLAGSGSELRETAVTQTSRVDRVDMSTLADLAGEASPGAEGDPELAPEKLEAAVEFAVEQSESVAARERIFLSADEIRSALPDRTYRLQVGDIVYGPVGVDGLLPLVKEGLLVAASGVSTDGGDWQPPSQHPALETLRRQLAHGIRDHLEVDRAFESRATTEGGSTETSGSDRSREDHEGRGGRVGEEDGGRSEPPPLPTSVREEQPPDEGNEETTDRALPTPPTDDAFESSEVSEGAGVPSPPAPRTPEEPPDTGPSTQSGREESPPRPDTAEIPNSLRTRVPSETTSAQAVSGVGREDGTADGERRMSALLIGVSLAVVLGAALFALGPSRVGAQIESAYDTLRAEVDSSPIVIKEGGETVVIEGDRDAVSVRRAILAAHTTVGEAVQIETSSVDLQRRVARRLASSGRPDDAADVYEVLWSRGKARDRWAGDYIDVLLRAGRWEWAREVAVEGIQRFENAETYVSRFRETLRRDPALGEGERVELDDWSGWGALRAPESLAFDGLVVERENGRPAFLFAPSTGGERKWRDDVAAWRLCRILQCAFDIPRTRPARMSRETLEQYLEGDPGAIDPSELDWLEEPGPDGAMREYVYGSLRDWPGDVVRWPLQARDVWFAWLYEPGRPESWERSLGEALDGLRDVGGRDFAAPVAERAGDLEVPVLAGQLSDIFVFDYLTNNWNRFRDEQPGAFNHFGPRGFVTYRTETALQLRNSTRVKGRFEWISQFRRDTITALRALEPATLTPMLYPDPSGLEEEKVDILRGQRRRLLERIDALVAEHGPDDVYRFD